MPVVTPALSEPETPAKTPWRQFLIRGGLTAAAVAACLQFEWNWMRYLTSEAVLVISNVLGTDFRRTATDMLEFRGEQFRFDTSCTLIDAFCGAIPLLWNLKRSIAYNLTLLGKCYICLFAINVVRLGCGNSLYEHGLPWWLAHDMMSAVLYFALFRWILSLRSWTATP